MKIIGRSTVFLKDTTPYNKNISFISGILVDFFKEEVETNGKVHINSENMQTVNNNIIFGMLLHEDPYLDGYHPSYIDKHILKEYPQYRYSMHLGKYNVEKIQLTPNKYYKIKIV